MPRPDVPRINRPDPPKAQEGTPRRPDKEPREGSSKGVINMISGGSTDGDSNRARKSWNKREILGIEARRIDPCPIITFGPGDLEGVCLTHNDPLFIWARVANYDVRRVFVDLGSSVNVIFQAAFEQMNLQGCEINPVKTSLYGFAGYTVWPRGELWLPITLGSDDIKRTVMTLFTVVEAPSSYNVILGRPALNAFMVVASAYHQKIKFPVGNRVDEVKGDQHSSRWCMQIPSGWIIKGPGEGGKRRCQTGGRATYQRMMDKVFQSQLGRNVEVYVDDILVKSRTRDHFISNLEETFGTLRRYGVKLNPAKCVFGVKSGKFLGFVVTERGIEVNPEKVKILREIPSPSSVREVQRLTGRITALSRFIARSAHRSHPLFQVLRKAQRFGWSEDCERAFQELKEHLANFPILVKPKPGERYGFIFP
ncbi:uncharacterized protein [Henckelia pumila]|uniref:uncharacterized protein n=1 Tax=Henckelia pumila TaxID=405737 RepID=UPI003C6DC563